jgi:hypothetical protein
LEIALFYKKRHFRPEKRHFRPEKGHFRQEGGAHPLHPLNPPMHMRDEGSTEEYEMPAATLVQLGKAW